MNLIVKIVLGCAIIAGAGTGALYAKEQGWLGEAQLPTLTEARLQIGSAIAGTPVESLTSDAAAQAQLLGERLLVVQSQTSTVLGTAIEATGEASVQEKAFDYGRYLYCQQVVKEYEAKE